MSQFDEFIGLVLANGKMLAKDLFAGFVQNAEDDIRAFLDSLEADLRTWTQLLADGDLTRLEFEDLVKGSADLAELAALTRAGIALAQLERFRSGLIEIVTNAAFDVFWPI